MNTINDELKKANYEDLVQSIFYEGEVEEDFRYGSGLIIRNEKYNVKFLLQS
jgi:hypothetical protein